MWVWLHVDMTSWWEGTALTSHKYLPFSWDSVHNPRHSLIVPLTKWTLLSKKKKDGPRRSCRYKTLKNLKLFFLYLDWPLQPIKVENFDQCLVLLYHFCPIIIIFLEFKLSQMVFVIKYKLSHQSLPIQIPPYFTLKHPPTFTYAPLNERHHSFSSQILILPLYHI